MVNEPQSFMEVIDRDCCRYISGHSDSPKYCGEAKAAGRSYCTAHTGVAYQKPRNKKVKADEQA